MHASAYKITHFDNASLVDLYQSVDSLSFSKAILARFLTVEW